MKLGFALIIFSIFFSCNKVKKIEDINLIPVLVGENYEYINTKGEIIINPQFSSASIFREGIALVKTSGEDSKWGFIDEEGKYLINPSYKSATIFSEDLAFVVSENGAPSAINKKGEIKFTLKDADVVRIFKNGLAAFAKTDSIENKWGFVNKDGKTVINPQFNEASDFKENKCAIKNKDNKWGYINKEGKIIINCQFDDVQDFENNTAVVYLKEKAGVIDENGKYIINPQFSSLQQDGDIYIFRQDDKWGWCDNKGKIIINPQFETATRFNGNELAAVKTDKQYGYIDKKGKIVINPQFDFAASFNNNLALVESSDKTGFIDKEGKFSINPQFDGYSFDYLTYVYRGASIYESVQTDYFNANKIVDRLILKNPEGISFFNNFSEIIQKFNINSSNLDRYESNLKIYNEKAISKDAKLSFEIMGQVFNYNSNYEKIFMGNNKPQGFVYQISLVGNAKGKSKTILDLLKLKVKSYELIKSGFFKKSQTYVCKNNECQIVISEYNDEIAFYILKSDYDLSNYISNITSASEQLEDETPAVEAPVDYPAADTTASYN